ncbi:unnamed protein product [Rotaria socialis]|uniref:Uncharacterized protein n=1 Tax=Rotaria socialis TaxID=392032 RepID=A0A820XD48_9BILA|nr:unnamed protein product [Rotaria socialis]CAF4531370.1 unnamed protein product [Rotaria socialis]
MLTKNKLLNEVISTKKFDAIIADETEDISEVFFGFAALSDTTAAGIAKAIATFIQASGPKIEKNRDQGYDGANVVAG